MLRALRRILPAVLLLGCVLQGLVAQSLDDELFAEEIIQGEGASESGAPAGHAGAASAPASLDARPGIEWGGRVQSEYRAGWTWVAADYDRMANLQWPTSSWHALLNTTLFFDARPEKQYRVFGKLYLAYPFERNALASAGAVPVPTIAVRELFTDISWQNLVKIRAGKHTIKWGVGYLFSPADVLSLTALDPTDPDAEREGPLSIRLQVPFGVNMAAAWLIADGISRPEELAAAARLDLVWDNVELGLGTLLRLDRAPKAVLTLTGSIRDWSLFAEGLLQYGSNRRILVQSGTGLLPGDFSLGSLDGPLAKASVGGMYFKDNALLVLQYLYNGEGYADPAIVGRALKSGAAVTLSAQGLVAADLLQPGQHYLAAMASWQQKSDRGPGLNGLVLFNAGDQSGLLRLGCSWMFWKHAIVKLTASWSFGDIGDEYSLQSRGPSVEVSASLGTGSF